MHTPTLTGTQKVLFLCLFFTMTLGVLAQGATVAHASVCSEVGSTLSYGSSDRETGGQVSALQRFLIATEPSLFPNGEVTGFFGRLTERAVQRYQEREGLAQGGTPDSTGYGATGPRTRAAFSRACVETSSVSYRDIPKIDVYYSVSDQSATVDVLLDSAEDITFDMSYKSRSSAVKEIGERLEHQYQVDFGKLSDAKRNAKIKKLVRWNEEMTDSDNSADDSFTEDDIKDITIDGSAQDQYVRADIDMRHDDNIRFDIVRETRDRMVEAIAEKLERSHDFDFGSFSSDRRRDEFLDSRTTVNITTGTTPPPTNPTTTPSTTITRYTLTDVATISHVVASDLSTVYTITLKNGSTRTVTTQKSMTAAQISLAFGASGYTGVARTLIAQSVVSKNYTLADVRTVSYAVVSTTTSYTITLKNATKRLVRTTNGMTSAQIVRAFTASGYTGNTNALIALSHTASSGAYTLTDVQKVTKSTVIATNPTRFTVTYKVTLRNGKVHTFTRDLTKTQETFELAVKATGYTGSISGLVNIATEVTTSGNAATSNVATPSTSSYSSTPTSSGAWYATGS